MKTNNTLQHTIFLSRAERRIGSRLYLRFTALNGLGITFIGDATVTLLAIHFGAGNLELGIISAMLNMSGIVLLIIPRIFKGKNVVKVAFCTWLIRGFISIPYMALFFLEGRAAVTLVMALYGLFCVVRTVGISMVMTIQKRLMVRSTQVDIIYRNSSSFQRTQILSRLISYFVLASQHLAELSGLLILQLIGVITNTMASLFLGKIPNRTQVEYHKGENLFVIFVRNMQNPQKRRILLLRWFSLFQLILFAMVIPFLRRSVGFSSASIFVYTIFISLAALISSIVLRPLADRAGSRPIVFFAAIPTTLLFLCWIFIPDHYSQAIYMLTGFATMIFLNALFLAVSRLLISITPDEGSVTFNAMESFITSILALFLGLTAGFLADFSHLIGDQLFINDYGLVFIPAALAAFIQIFLAFKVDEKGSISLRDAARIITNLGNFRIWQTVFSLETTADPVKRQTLVRGIAHSRAPVASVEIEKVLREPLSYEKGEIFDALFFTKRPEMLDFICEEALSSSAFYRERAIFALGAYPDNRVEKLLTSLLSDPKSRVRALAAKSLGRIGSMDELERVYEYWEKSDNLHDILDYMIALFHMDPERRYIGDLFSFRFSSSGERIQQSIFTLLSRQFGMVPLLGIFYRDEMIRYGKGVDLLLEESQDTRFLLEHREEIGHLWFQRQYSKIWELCHEALSEVSVPPVLLPILRSILSFPVGEADAANGLAVQYFTYQILTAEMSDN